MAQPEHWFLLVPWASEEYQRFQLQMSVVGTQDLAERLMGLAGLKTLASASAVPHLAAQSSLLVHPELEHFHLPVPLGAVAISLQQP